MGKIILIVSGITVIFAIMGLTHQLTKTDDTQKVIDNYIKLDETAQGLLDMCEKDGQVLKIDRCREAALLIIDTCNHTETKPPVCKDERLYKIFE